MPVEYQICGDEKDLAERRNGPVDRRAGLPDVRDMKTEQRLGSPDRRIATNDMDITVITSSGEYDGTINLDFAYERADRTSDFFSKSDTAFITLYNTVLMGHAGKVNFINVKDIAVVIPKDNIFPEKPELRQDAQISVKLKYGLGNIAGTVNLMGESRQVDRISDLLNYPGKKWLVVYNVTYKGRHINAVLIHLEFISTVED